MSSNNTIGLRAVLKEVIEMCDEGVVLREERVGSVGVGSVTHSPGKRNDS
jgi:hypothetical protein